MGMDIELALQKHDIDHLLQRATVLVDRIGHATLNITLEEFNQLRAGRRFEMIVRENILTEVVSGYAAARDAGNGRGALLLTVSISGYLQVAMRQYSAQQYFGLREHDSIFVRFL